MYKAHYHGIPCYFNPDTHELRGRNWFTDKIVFFLIWFDYYMLYLDELDVYIDSD